MKPAPVAPAAPPALGLIDVVSIIVGIIIGVSIFKVPAGSFGIFHQAGGPYEGLAAWALGGLLSLAGALCYAELASAYPVGGDYTFLTRAFGRPIGFLFGWAELSIIRTGGSIGAMAYVFADYATVLAPLGPSSVAIYAVLAVVGLAIVNALGLRVGTRTQNLLTAGKVIALGGIVLVGLLWAFRPPTGEPPPAPDFDKVPPSFALAMVLIFYAYGGWNEAGYVAAELRDRRRNTLRTLVGGVTAVTLIYLAVNAAYLAALGYAGVCASKAPAADVLALPLGELGAKLMSLIVAVSALGAVNGLLFAGMRLYGTFGVDVGVFRHRAGPIAPRATLLAQVFFSLLLIGAFETGRHWKPEVASATGLYEQAPLAEGFESLVFSTAPVFWLFFLLSGLALFVLRWRDPDAERPFRVPLYPLVPLLFCASSAFMLYRSTTFALEQRPAEAVLVAGLLLTGLPLLALSGLLGWPRTD